MAEEPQLPAANVALRVTNLIIGALCVLYLLNPTWGFFELLPDNLPIVGNLDEAAAVAGIMAVLRNLGIIQISGRQ
jgi:hypothetical protein